MANGGRCISGSVFGDGLTGLIEFRLSFCCSWDNWDFKSADELVPNVMLTGERGLSSQSWISLLLPENCDILRFHVGLQIFKEVDLCCVVLCPSSGYPAIIRGAGDSVNRHMSLAATLMNDQKALDP